MTFITAVAGPSRLPWRAVTPLLSSARRATTDAAPTPETAEPPVEADDKDSRSARIKEKQFYGTKEGYHAWIRTGAASQFFDVNKGQKARWLDENMPYPTNPSFRPPPPISNDLQDTIYRHLKRGQKTVGQISEQYNISKARIEAIRKLKQVEDEFRRQDLPLQLAFHKGMEPLLGVEPPRNQPGAKQSVLDRQAAQYREEIPGTAVEREEEERLDAGIGGGGAFGTKSKKAEGIERTVWEFRSEEMVMAERKAEAQAAKAVDTEAEKKVAEQEAAPDTPDQVHVEAEVVKARKEFPVKTVKPGKTKIRFVDTSR